MRLNEHFSHFYQRCNQVSLICPDHVLHYINDLPKSIIRSFVNIYADSTMVYGCTSKILNDQILAADHSTDLDLTAQCGKSWLVAFNAAKTKPITSHPHRTDPELASIKIKMNRSSLMVSLFLERVLGINSPKTSWNSYILLLN